MVKTFQCSYGNTSNNRKDYNSENTSLFVDKNNMALFWLIKRDYSFIQIKKGKHMDVQIMASGVRLFACMYILAKWRGSMYGLSVTAEPNRVFVVFL